MAGFSRTDGSCIYETLFSGCRFKKIEITREENRGMENNLKAISKIDLTSLGPPGKIAGISQDFPSGVCDSAPVHFPEKRYGKGVKGHDKRCDNGKQNDPEIYLDSYFRLQ